jgi:hypothetical protein
MACAPSVGGAIGRIQEMPGVTRGAFEEGDGGGHVGEGARDAAQALE